MGVPYQYGFVCWLLNLKNLSTTNMRQVVLRGLICGKPNPASTTSVERSLEEVVINFNHRDAGSSSGVCAVCMEEFESGIEAARTPCSHVYHRHCIAKWLQESNTCPLRRRELSS
jgi:hypothetical protein